MGVPSGAVTSWPSWMWPARGAPKRAPDEPNVQPGPATGKTPPPGDDGAVGVGAGGGGGASTTRTRARRSPVGRLPSVVRPGALTRSRATYVPTGTAFG